MGDRPQYTFPQEGKDIGGGKVRCLAAEFCAQASLPTPEALGGAGVGAILKKPCPPAFRKVKPAEAETAGAIMAFFLSLGLALGAVFSFLFRSIV